jgi:hypothetical protein
LGGYEAASDISSLQTICNFQAPQLWALFL